LYALVGERRRQVRQRAGAALRASTPASPRDAARSVFASALGKTISIAATASKPISGPRAFVMAFPPAWSPAPTNTEGARLYSMARAGSRAGFNSTTSKPITRPRRDFPDRHAIRPGIRWPDPAITRMAGLGEAGARSGL
jgi:hypothetical protein